MIEDKLDREIESDRVRDMISPVIMMNKKDLEDFVGSVKSRVPNLKVGKELEYRGIPIETDLPMDKGSVGIYDSRWMDKFNI